MRVLYFGTYERTYPRNAQVIACLRRAGVDVYERHEPVWETRRDGWRAGFSDVLCLAAAEFRLLKRRSGRFDAVIVGYPGHFDLLAARRAARGAPVVFNPLVSLADTLVSDRARFLPGSPMARSLAAVDRWALRSADIVVSDTAAHARFLAELGGLDERRVAVCFVGAEALFSPGWTRSEPFIALFVGKLIPLHGLATIVEAARLLPEIPFRIIGSGQLESVLADLPPNVERRLWVDYECLPQELHRAGCALGIFGTSDKAQRVIPNKAFQAVACGTPLVTADTEAAREFFTDGESALLVPPGNPQALAAAIARIAGDAAFAGALSEGGLRIYRDRASEAVLGERWRRLLECVVSKGP